MAHQSLGKSPAESKDPVSDDGWIGCHEAEVTWLKSRVDASTEENRHLQEFVVSIVNFYHVLLSPELWADGTWRDEVTQREAQAAKLYQSIGSKKKVMEELIQEGRLLEDEVRQLHREQAENKIVLKQLRQELDNRIQLSAKDEGVLRRTVGELQEE